jgi:hypothetical protein
MKGRATIGQFLALLAVVGLMLAPLVHAKMAMPAAAHAMPMAATATDAAAHMVHAGMADVKMADMGMADMGTADADMASVMDAMPCCPHMYDGPTGQAPVPDCGGDCPFMALCSAMPLSVPVASLIAPLAEASVVLPGDQSDLTGRSCAPPRRPPKHPGSSAV